MRTHTIGKEILNHNWMEVCRLILAQYVDYIEGSKEKKDEMVRLVFDPKVMDDPHKMVDNIEDALDMCEPRDRLERTILQSLRSSPNGYYNAFVSISKGTRFIYIHAYQSYIWNTAVSERIRKFGKKVLIGDLVMKSGSDLPVEENEGSDIEGDDPKEEAKGPVENID